MSYGKKLSDGLCGPALALQARQLLGAICVLGGADCPLIEKEQAKEFLARIKADPTAAIRLESDADTIPHYTTLSDKDYAALNKKAVFNRKRDLDILQRLGLAPGDTRRSRYLIELLFKAIETPDGICAYDTPGWEGCPQVRSGAYEGVREKGWKAVVYDRPEEEKADYRRRSVERIEKDGRLFIRPHHLMCLSCWLGGSGGEGLRGNDTLAEIYQRVKKDPDVQITFVEGCCEACGCCDGFHPETSRCVHACGLIRDYKKDLDVFQKLGLMPGATLTAREAFKLL
ncbi:MAG: hypothetical protein GXP25_24865, partial [Planctomycetes bacterium]|nr:hypothetical protein [Planctomycetota bacterium]